MNKENKLTAVEYAHKRWPNEEGNLEDDINAAKRSIFLSGVAFLAQNTAEKDARIAELETDVSLHKSECEQLTLKSKTQKARIKELESVLSEVYKNRAGEKEELISSINRIKELEEQNSLQKERADAEAKSGNEIAKSLVLLAKELEAVKKEREHLLNKVENDREEIHFLKMERDTAYGHRYGAVKLLEKWLKWEPYTANPNNSPDCPDIETRTLLSRLSSGETKPEFHCNNKGMHYSDPGFKRVCEKQCAECAEEYPSNNSSSEKVICDQPCDYESIQNNDCNCMAPNEEETESPWISVEDRPLVIITKNGWECTTDGMNEFIAAVPYRDKRQPGKELWWIRHCVIEDEIGLCIVGDNENIPAGWSLQDITHYWPLPAPPESLTDKK